MNPTFYALADVGAERRRQNELRDAGRFSATCADPHGLANAQRLAVLVEEVGEVARETLAGDDLVQDGRGRLREELVQVAAVAVAWIEGIDAEASA